MRGLKIVLATLIVLAIMLLFGSDIAVDTLTKVQPDLAFINPNSPPIKGDPVYDEALDEHEEDVVIIDVPVEEKRESVKEKIVDGDIIILPPREPTLVDGTKKAITIRDRFVLGAVTQYGVTNSYNGAYKKISYPNGDVDISTGVCTDVIVRAFRSVDIDLQREMHRDMKRNFRKYPK
ncbi:MAG: DUF1287 domain-containing protein, partial [Cocleimonas sp.]|nr:DUF1287 domain-containing protein [Cocleimonas sp.]